jgi:hypothetical protein
VGGGEIGREREKKRERRR